MPDPTYPPAHKRVEFQGTLAQAPGGGSDIFAFGFADDSALTIEALAAALAPVYSSFFGGTEAGCSEYAQATGVRCESILADGTVAGSYYVAITPVSGLATGFTTTILTTAVTLETATPDGHGRMVRGRFYPPAIPAGPEGSTVAIEAARDFAGSWRDFVQNCNTAGAVASVASVTAGGQIAHVIGTSCGTVLDTQRRRKNHVTVQRTAIYDV